MLRSTICAIFIVLSFDYCQCQSTISSVTNYSDQTITSTHLNNLRDISALKKNQPIMTSITGSGPGYGTNTWGNGTWLEGYASLYSWAAFYGDSEDDKFLSNHPLTRHTSEFTRSHLHSYIVTSNSNDLDYAKFGIDYLLAHQQPSGAYVLWSERPDHTQPNIDHTIGDNTLDIYPTSHALRTLAEFHLSGIDHRREEVYHAVVKSADYLENISWSLGTQGCTGDPNPGAQNANNHGFALWALAGAYKVTLKCDTYTKIKEIATNLIEGQTTTGLMTGLWQTGGFDVENFNTTTSATYDHDTHTQYHMITLRGLTEALDVISEFDINFRPDLIECIKLAINHIIENRLGVPPVDPPVNYGMRIYTGDKCGTIHTPHQNYYYTEYFVPITLETLSLLAHNAKFDDAFSASEKADLEDLQNYMAMGIAGNAFLGTFDQNWKFYLAYTYYASYSNAINSDTKLFAGRGRTWGYDPGFVNSRFVSGDFDGDGDKDDIATFYNYGSSQTAIHVWKSDGLLLEYQGSGGWWSSSVYDATKITGRIVSGDFNNDQKDDIAAFYDYGDNEVHLHVWISTGSSFTYSGYMGWWNTGPGPNGYNANQIIDRVVSGDFNHDGNDDIAAMYYYGSGLSRIHVWTSTSTTMNYSGYMGWWNNSNYYADNVSHRIVCGDYDHDGYNDDIVALYDYSTNKSSTTKIHVWKSNGINGFNYSGFGGWWSMTGLDADKMTGKVVSGDFNENGYEDGINGFYDHGGGLTKAHTWNKIDNYSLFTYSTNWYNSGSGGFYSNNIVGRVASGDFDNDGYNGDIMTMYNYGDNSPIIFGWESTNSSFEFPYSAWSACYAPSQSKSSIHSDSFEELNENSSTEVDIHLSLYPNPGYDHVTVILEGAGSDGQSIVKVHAIDGTLMFETNFTGNKAQLDIADFTNGMFVVSFYNDNELFIEKLIKQ